MTRARVRQRGAVLVETALVLTLLFLFAFGAAEFGLLWRDANRIEHAIQSGGRVGSNVADGRLADFQLLRSLDVGLAGLSGGEVERVVVFRATSTNGTVPPACRTLDVEGSSMATHGVANTCNVYSKEQLEDESGDGFANPGSCSGDWDSNFCPLDRSRSTGNSTYLGVFVRTIYTPITSVVAGPVTIDRTTVYRLEPCIPSLENCD